MKLRTLAIWYALLFWAAPCWAEDPKPSTDDKSQYYVSGFFGLSLPVDSDLETATGGNAGKLSFNADVMLGGAVGMRFTEPFRLEAEWAYRNYDADQVKVSGAVSPATGQASIFSFMVNGYRDIPTKTPWTPYLGIGVGGANVSWKDVASPVTVTIDHSDLVFAFQFLAGVGYPITPSFTVTGGYRMFATSDPKFTAADSSVIFGEVITHNFTVGGRYSF